MTDQAEPADQTSLERSYRRLLRSYPRRYRERRGEEMVATLLETAAPGQRRPSRRDVADLGRGALRERLQLNALPGLSGGLRVVAPISLVVAAGHSASLWASGFRSGASTVVTAGWVLAALVLVARPRLLAWASAAAWLATIVVILLTLPAPQVVVDPDYVIAPAPTSVFTIEVWAGLIVLITALSLNWRPSIVERAGVGAALAVAVGLTAAGVLASGEELHLQALGLTAVPDALATPAWLGLVRVTALIMIAVGLVLAVRRRSTVWLWGGALLLTMTPLIAPLSRGLSAVAIGHYSGNAFYGTALAWYLGSWPLDFGQLDWISLHATTMLLGAGIAVAAAAASAHQSGQPRNGRRAMSTLAGIALGTTGAICGYLLAARIFHDGLTPRDLMTTLSPAMAALAVPLLPLWLRRPVLLLVMAGVVAAAYAGRVESALPEFLAAVVFLLFVAQADVRARFSQVAWSGVAALALILAILGGSNLSLWPRTTLETQVAILPAVAGVVVAIALWWAPYVIVRGDGGWFAAMFAFAAALTWLAVQVQFAGDTQLLIALIATVASLPVIVRIGRRIFARPVQGTG